MLPALQQLHHELQRFPSLSALKQSIATIADTAINLSSPTNTPAVDTPNQLADNFQHIRQLRLHSKRHRTTHPACPVAADTAVIYLPATIDLDAICLTDNRLQRDRLAYFCHLLLSSAPSGANTTISVHSSQLRNALHSYNICLDALVRAGVLSLVADEQSVGPRSCLRPVRRFRLNEPHASATRTAFVVTDKLLRDKLVSLSFKCMTEYVFVGDDGTKTIHKY